MVISNTSAVDVIIQAVSPALILSAAIIPDLFIAEGAASGIADVLAGAEVAVAPAKTGDSVCALQVLLNMEKMKVRDSKKLESTRIFINLAFSKTSSMTHKHVCDAAFFMPRFNQAFKAN